MLWFFIGCAPVGYQSYSPSAAAPEALANARHYLRTKPGWNIDCSNFVKSCYHSPEMQAFFLRQPAGENLVVYLNRYLEAHGRKRGGAGEIQPGDILLFHYTYDKNGDGRIDGKDSFTHAGIAESMEGGRLTYIDASKSRRPPILRRRSFSFTEGGPNEVVATDRATGRKIRHRETFFAAYGLE